MPSPIQFVFRGRTVAVEGAPVTRTVLQWLREDARATGTKEGCAEGDCGACTIAIGTLPRDGTPSTDATIGPDDARLTLRTVNACIALLPTLHGKALFTVEDLKQMSPGDGHGGKRLHPVQQAMVDCHGSQCGFCTPGFVMSLFNTYEHAKQCGVTPSRQQVADDLAGNLCRCTGYRPILDAATRMFELPAVRLETTPVVELLKAIEAAPGLSYAPNTAFPSATSVRADRYAAPTTLAEFASLRAERPDARLLAGSTDIGLWITKQFRDIGDVLYIGDVAELQRIDMKDGRTSIGAAVNLEDAYRALTRTYPELTEVWLRFASPPIRHAGTLVGNLANGSPIGDSAPMLMALGASLTLRKGERTRTVRLSDFYLAYMKNALEPGEFVQSVEVPDRSNALRFRGYKLSKRFDSDISAVACGLALEVDDGIVRAARFTFGGLAATVKHATNAEAAVIGQPWNEATMRAAMQGISADFTPLTDQRATKEYRTKTTANLLQRFWLETRDDAPLKPEEVSVFARTEAT